LALDVERRRGVRGSDLQVCTDLGSGEWTGVESNTFIDGHGGEINMTDPLAGRPKAFFRLVEYQ